ncbi:claspin-like isoform X2 [Dysidea avara]|uniref:claspin-like isoform X2 n=1 Tax=Dysidea avara TaxID=196820 RepID=UPI00332F1124
MDVASSSGEDDIGISTLRRRRRTKCVPQDTKETDSEDERPSEISVSKSVVRGRKFVFKESDTSDSDDESEEVAKVSKVKTTRSGSSSQARTSKSPPAILEENQFDAPSPKPFVSERKTRKSIKQQRIKELQEQNAEYNAKMDSLVSKHSDLFDRESDNEDNYSAPSASPPNGYVEDEQSVKKMKRMKEPKPARMSKKKQMELHSESQRMIREAEICLPKYQPKVKTLDDFLTKLKSRNTERIKPIKRDKENVKPEAKLMPDTVTDATSILPSANSQDEPVVMSVETTTVSHAVQKDEQASQDAISNMNEPNPSISQTDTLLHQNHDTFLLELENSEQSQWTRSSDMFRSQIMKVAKGRPAPRLSSHLDWEKSEIVSPVEELQKRLSKHATVSAVVEVVETTEKSTSAFTRDEFKSTLRKQISERRASERKAMEEATKLDNEYISDHESEAELTDDDDEPTGFGNKEEMKEEIGEAKVDKEMVAEDFTEGSHESKGNDDTGWMSDCSEEGEEEDGSSSSDDLESDGAEGDEESDDELVVKSNKRSAKQLESDSETDEPIQDKSLTTPPPIRNFPFDKETSETNDFTNYEPELKDEALQDKQSVAGGKVLVDSGLGTSLIDGALEEAGNDITSDSFATSSSQHPIIDDDTNGEKVPKRPSEDDTNITTESGSILSDTTELDRSRGMSTSMCNFDEETQFLDSNGFLNVQVKSKPTDVFSSIPEVPSQLLQLCSGQFSSQNMPSSIVTTPKKVTDLNQSSLQRKDSKDLPTTQGLRELLGSQETDNKPSSKPTNNISSLLGVSTCEGDDGSQLLALCSGKFSTQLTPFNRGKLETSDGLSNDDSSSDDSGDDLMGLTRGKPAGSSQVANGLFGQNNSDDEMPRLSKRKSRKFLKNRERNIKRRKLEEFVESEAELSGSDHGVPSDEERAYLDNEKDDVFERWSGDSDVTVSDDELQKQVNRVHMKYTLADDSAKIKDIKEQFLPGGDLFEDGMMLKDGYFRKRKFAHVGSEASLDLFADNHMLDSEDEQQFDDESLQAEALRRKEWLEKEEFLAQMRKQESLLDDEDSQQVLKLIKTPSVKISAPTIANRQRPSTIQLFSAKVTKHSCGSFLKRNKTELSKLSSSVAANMTVNMSSSRNFVFQTKSTPTTTPSEKNVPQLKKSHTVKHKNQGKSPRKSGYKRSRSLPQDEDSIFNVLN